MITLKSTAISTKYNKYSHLIGGLIMLIIGLLMIVRIILDKTYDIFDKKKNKSDSPKNQEMIKRQAAIH